MPNKIDIFYTLEAWQMIKYAVDFRNQEVAGFGRCHFDGERLIVDDILIPPQVVGGAHAELDIHAGDYDWLLAQIIGRGEAPLDWRLWWHSHVNMGTSPSGTDHNTLKMLSKYWEGWAAGTVFNQRGEATGWMALNVEYDMTNPLTRAVEHIATQTEVDLTVMRALVPEAEELRARVHGWMEHVEYVAPVTSVPVSGGNARYAVTWMNGNRGYWADSQFHLLPGNDLPPFVKGKEDSAAGTTFQPTVVDSDKRSGRGKGKRSKVTQSRSAIDRGNDSPVSFHPSGRKWVADMDDEEWKAFISSAEYRAGIKDVEARGGTGTDFIVKEYADAAQADGLARMRQPAGAIQPASPQLFDPAYDETEHFG